MANIKISSKVDEAVWEALKTAAHESNQNISGMVNEAIAEYLQRRRVRPAVLSHLDDAMRENAALGVLLAK